MLLRTGFSSTWGLGQRPPRWLGFTPPRGLEFNRPVHPLPPGLATTIGVLAFNDADVIIDQRDGYTPTPVISHAILAYNQGRTGCLRWPRYQSALGCRGLCLPERNPLPGFHAVQQHHGSISLGRAGERLRSSATMAA